MQIQVLHGDSNGGTSVLLGNQHVCQLENMGFQWENVGKLGEEPWINDGKLVGGLEHEFYDFPFSWEVHHPN